MAGSFTGNDEQKSFQRPVRGGGAMSASPLVVLPLPCDGDGLARWELCSPYHLESSSIWGEAMSPDAGVRVEDLWRVMSLPALNLLPQVGRGQTRPAAPSFCCGCREGRWGLITKRVKKKGGGEANYAYLVPTMC